MGNVNQEKVSNTIKFKKNRKYKIKVEYFESRQNAFVNLFWQSKSQSKEIIPATAFTTSEDTIGKQGLTGVYSSMKQHIAYTTNNNNLYAIALEWPNNELVLNIPEPAKETKIQLLGREGDLKWIYKNDRLHIDISEIKYNEMPSNHAWTFKINDYLN